MNIPDKCRDTQMLVADFIKRRRWFVGLLVALYYTWSLAIWLRYRESAATPVGGAWWTAVYMILLATVPQGFIRDSNQKVLRSLPVSKGNRGLAVWIEAFVLPLCLCIPPALLVFLVYALVGQPLFRSVESILFFIAANAFVLAARTLLYAGVLPALVRLHAIGTVNRLDVVTNCLLLLCLAPQVALIRWCMTELPPLLAAGMLGALAAVFATFSFSRRSHLDIDLRTLLQAQPGQGNTDTVPVMHARNWRLRQDLWLGRLRAGIVGAAIMGASIAAWIHWGVPISAITGPEMVPLTGWISIIGLGTGACCAGMGMIGPWGVLLRALRMLPVSRDHIVRTFMARQLSLTLPPVAVTCLAAALWIWSGGDLFVANIAMGTALGTAAFALVMLPFVLQFPEERQTLWACIMTFLGFAGVGICYQATELRIITPAMHAVIGVLPLMGVVALVASAVFCFRRLQSLVGDECGAYQKRTWTN